ncbi:glucocorticoid-induced transcript 1 protein isoform X2 [Agrilus planipennis]|uniref:Glucocorticoid-induced transcript 1 protein isoform X2 n=1 Tax=Agrilus planipennis TaxID=224129 RepID=A0A1W4WJK5_AGRPL|nr:glucocorticoid-induced transcript 1 protein isoform X2 [Agrilus planipennis]
MSGHTQGTPARVRKSSPSSKQGPLKATVPMSSLLKNSNNLRRNSPNLSPTCSWKNRFSPDRSSGQRSPGSASYRGKSESLEHATTSDVIRRTASLDTIYLKGQWPRDMLYWQHNFLQVDKATQTDEADLLDARKMHVIAENSEDKLEKVIIRQRLQRNNKDSTGKHLVSPSNLAMAGDHSLVLPSTSSQTSASFLVSPISKANPINIPLKPIPKPTIRSSVEGLNQEIERLVLRTSLSGSDYFDKNEDFGKFCQVVPEGHRAPLAEIFRTTRSVNTQTPVKGEFTGSCHSSGPPSRESASPLIPGHLDSSPGDTGGSQGSSPDHEGGKLGTSPHINRFLAREPPDGCEKVHLKSLNEKRDLTLDSGPQPCSFQLKPSLGSAFQLLQPSSNSSPDRELPLVPSQPDFV